jgi:phosphodiesterase/alkaline phosphatase D-like protein
LTLGGSVNPEGQPTTYVFQYGTSSAYGSQTPSTSAGSGTKAVSASAVLGGLAPNTTYHYRLAATNVNGTTYGHDLSFKTAVLPPA